MHREIQIKQFPIVTTRGVTRHLSHETRRDTRLGSRERDETRFLDFFKINLFFFFF